MLFPQSGPICNVMLRIGVTFSISYQTDPSMHAGMIFGLDLVKINHYSILIEIQNKFFNLIG